MGRYLVVAIAVVLFPQAAAADVKLLFNERSPYMSQVGNEVRGLTADAASAALRTAGVPFTWSNVPAARQIDDVKRGDEPVCGLGWFKNAEREGFARFTKPLYRDRPMAVLARKDDARVTAKGTLDALLGDRDLVLLVKKSYSYGAFIDEKIAKSAPKTSETTVENNVLFKQIGASRADYMFASPEEAQPLIATPDGAGLTLAALSDMPEGGLRYLMCSKAVPEDVIAKIDAALP